MSDRTQRILRFLFSLLCLILLGIFVLVGHPIQAATAMIGSIAIVIMIARHARAALRLADPMGTLHAEILSAASALSMIVTSAIARRVIGIPVGTIDAVAAVSALYFVWRLRRAHRFVKADILPPSPETGLEYARRTLSETWRRFDDGKPNP